MRYAIRTLWHERRRYIAGVLAVAFSCVLIALQVGIFWGLISVVSVPIVNSRASVWVMYPNTAAADLGRPIPTYWSDRLWANPDIDGVDEYIQGFSFWTTKSGINEMVIVLGCNVTDKSLGPIAQLNREQRSRLTEPGAVILDANDRKRLEVDAVGQVGEVAGRRVRVVGFVPDMGSVSGCYVICSLETARSLLQFRNDQTTFLLATCKNNSNPREVAAKLEKSFSKFSALESEEFSIRSKIHFIRKTKAGVAVTFVAFLGLAVGASVTSQTLYAATTASLKELAVLRALGIPRWRMNLFVFQQSMLVGMMGLAIGLPLTLALAGFAASMGTNALLPTWLLGGTAALTLVMSLFSGLIASRALRNAEPATLLR